MIRRFIRICEIVIPSKVVLIFPQNLFDFGLDTIEKQGIIDFSSYRSKSYASVVLSDSGIAFFGEGKRNNIWNLTFTAPQTSPDKSLCDWSRAIIGNQAEHARNTTLVSALGYKYKRKREISLFDTLQTVQVRC